MKFMKKSLVIATLALASAGAMANWNTGVSYSNLDTGDFDLGVITANVGYTFSDHNSNWSIMPEVRLGTGVDGDRGIDIDQYLIVAARVDYQATDSVSFFVQPAYVNIEVDDFDQWDFGVGIGSTFEVNNNWSVELMYENFNDFDDADVVSFGARYHF